MNPKRLLVGAAMAAVLAGPALAAPTVRRLTPPSSLFSTGQAEPIVARFLPEQRFDLQATITPDSGLTISEVRFFVDGNEVPGSVAFYAADASGVPAGSIVATLRAYSLDAPGVHTLRVEARQNDGQIVADEGNFEIVSIEKGGLKAKNVIFMIGDGMGIAHRTAARLMLKGVSQGKPNGLLEMDTFPTTGIVVTHSLNSIVTDSSPGAACYASGNKANNNQQNVFPDDTRANFDNPRVEHIGEYLSRTRGKSLGIVTTSDVFDATPGSFGSHTQSRGAGTGIVDQYLDESEQMGLKVLLGGGRKWYLPAGTPGSARSASSDYVLPEDLAAAWGVAAGAIDAGRDLIADHEARGWTYVADATELRAADADRLLGLFAYSNMNVALDKIAGRRGESTVVNDYQFPDQPMLDEMTEKALDVLAKDGDGFTLMVEAASIDKQAHNMDTERWILDTIEFDRAIGVAKRFAEENEDTLVIVTADHECAGVNIIGGSRLSDADLADRAQSGGGSTQLRNGVVGTYESAGFPRYEIAEDGYPVTTDVDRRMLIGYAANADRYEDWRTNEQPLRDSQQPFNNEAPLNTYPNGPLARDVAGQFLVTGQLGDSVAAHTASDVPVSAFGRGHALFTGVMDNTDVFFKAMQAVIGGVNPATSGERPGPRVNGFRSGSERGTTTLSR
jgi:alkaline phosphatase